MSANQYEDEGAASTATGGSGQQGGKATQQLAGQVRETTDQVRRAKDDAVQQAGDALRQAGEGAQQVKRQLGEQAAEAARMIRERGTSMLGDQKGRAAGLLADIGNALADAGRRLDDERDPAIARYVHGAADQVNVLADYLKNKPAESLLGDLADAARRRPELLVGGMFLAGLALARFAKSTGSAGTSGTSRGGGVDHGNDYRGGRADPELGYGYYGGRRYADDFASAPGGTGTGIEPVRASDVPDYGNAGTARPGGTVGYQGDAPGATGSSGPATTAGNPAGIGNSGPGTGSRETPTGF